MTLGLKVRRLEVAEVMSERLFPSHVQLPEDLAEMYGEGIGTRQVERPRRHALRYAA